jgi:hypothetical protein
MKNLIIISLVFLFGCELVVDVDVPRQPSKITLNAAFTSDSTWNVQLRKSKYVLDEGEYLPIMDAILTIKEDGVIVDELIHMNDGFYMSQTGHEPVMGRQYEIEASAPGYETVSAQSSLPSHTEIISGVYEFHGNQQSSQNNYNFSIDLTFNDPASEENFYEIEVFIDYAYYDPIQDDTIHQLQPIYAFTDDPAFANENYNGIIFDDKIVNGKQVQIRVKGGDFWGDQTKYVVKLRSLSKDLYRYKLTSEVQWSIDGDPFAQPVHVHNNINNGFGIFGGFQESMIEVHP